MKEVDYYNKSLELIDNVLKVRIMVTIILMKNMPCGTIFRTSWERKL